jgi:hypothetical protein
MDEQTHKQKKMRKALQRLVAEVAYAQDLPADSEEAARLTFFLAAGNYQAVTKRDIVSVLRVEVDATKAALRQAGKPAWNAGNVWNASERFPGMCSRCGQTAEKHFTEARYCFEPPKAV